MPHTPPHQLVVTVLALLTAPFLLGVTASAASPPLPHPRTTSPCSQLRAGPPVGAGAAPSSVVDCHRQGGPTRAGPLSSPLVRSEVRFTWPLAPPHPVLRPFEAPASPYGPGHRGVDLGGSVDEPVLAPAEGVVVFAGPLAGRGVVSVDHPNGLRTTYEPVAPSVRRGQRVATGVELGLLRPGHARCTGAPACLHWGARRGTEYLDPLGLLSSGRVRLLPWEEVTTL